VQQMSNIRLLIYPLLEIILFWLATYSILDSHVGNAVAYGILASICLSFSVHITFHEIMHRTTNVPYKRLMSNAITILSGLPFDGYRIHHMNHHRYSNSFRDFSSTWRFSGNIIKSRNILRYSFGWPWHLARVRKTICFAHRRKYIPTPILTRITEQKYVSIVTLIIMGIISLKIILLYIAVVYLGWSWISVHNYLQHPPVISRRINSYYSSVYNLLFCNNGLHAEHHGEPGISWHFLQPAKLRAHL